MKKLLIPSVFLISLFGFIYPSEKEVQMNAPSRSAKLRYGIKLSHNSDFDDFIKKFQYLLDIENQYYLMLDEL